jgi:hypothetical protein
MPDPLSPDSMKNLWQSQKTEITPMSLNEIHSKARKFQTRIRWRNGREFAGGLLAAAFMAYFAWHASDGLNRTAACLCIAGITWVMIQLHRRGSARNLPSEMGNASYLDFHRRELERQRDLLGSVWSWYLAPLAPGLALFIAGGLTAAPGHLQHARLFVGGYAAFVVLVFGSIVWLNRRAARHLQTSIDQLNALERGK